jgi:hypothetical protein
MQYIRKLESQLCKQRLVCPVASLDRALVEAMDRDSNNNRNNS